MLLRGNVPPSTPVEPEHAVNAIEHAMTMTTDEPPRTVARVRWAAWFAPTLIATIVADQVTKYALFALPDDAHLPVWLERAVNPGVAWGVFGAWPFAVVAMTVLLIPLLTWVWWKHFRAAGAIENVAFGLILGGALGNAWDRLSKDWRAPWHGERGVRDFILVDLNRVGIDYKWPNFNIADAAICVGFFLLVLLACRRPRVDGAARAA